MSDKQEVLILIGPHKGKRATVIKIEFDAGARNGWYTVHLTDVGDLLYAGEEVMVLT